MCQLTPLWIRKNNSKQSLPSLSNKTCKWNCWATISIPFLHLGVRRINWIHPVALKLFGTLSGPPIYSLGCITVGKLATYEFLRQWSSSPWMSRLHYSSVTSEPVICNAHQTFFVERGPYWEGQQKVKDVSRSLEVQRRGIAESKKTHSTHGFRKMPWNRDVSKQN